MSSVNVKAPVEALGATVFAASPAPPQVRVTRPSTIGAPLAATPVTDAAPGAAALPPLLPPPQAVKPPTRNNPAIADAIKV